MNFFRARETNLNYIMYEKSFTHNTALIASEGQKVIGVFEYEIKNSDEAEVINFNIFEPCEEDIVFKGFIDEMAYWNPYLKRIIHNEEKNIIDPKVLMYSGFRKNSVWILNISTDIRVFKIDIKEQENVFLGIQEHEKQRLLSLSEGKNIRYYQNQIVSPTFYQDFNRILTADCISQGHNVINPTKYFSKKGKLTGIPDYIFQDFNGSFAVEEKYTTKSFEELTEPYKNHKIQALVYLYLCELDMFKFNEVYLIYWFIERRNGEYYVYNYRLFKLTRSKDHEIMILDVFNKLESIQNREAIEFPVNDLNYRKCVKCNYFPYCEYKKGVNSIIKLEPLDSSIIKDDIDLNV